MRTLPYFLILNKFSRLSVVKIFFLVSFSMVTHGWTFQTSEHTNATSIMAFADNLSHHGHHYRAFMEYERLKYFYPKHTDIPKARFKIACSMKSSANYTPALQIFSSLAEEYKGISQKIQKNLYLCLIMLMNHGKTLSSTLRI